MLIPKCLGSLSLDDDVLKADKRTMQKIGPCGLGKEAIYLNSFYIDRMYYVPLANVSRVYKRVAMSKGGFSGKGIFGSMPYLVVELKDGKVKQCNFKIEEKVDEFLTEFNLAHPEIPIHSAAAEARLREAEEKEAASYLKELTPQAEESIRSLKEAKEILEEKPILPMQLTFSARQKRVIDHINPTYQLVAGVILLLGIAAAVFGFYAFSQRMGTGIYFLLFGFAAIFMVMATRVLPTGRRNKKAAQEDWDQALREMEEYLDRREFPLPPQYAHPIVLDRMIRLIRQGRAQTEDQAFAVMKEDLKALNSTVKVSQKEYDEVVAIKPMFLVCDYQ